MMVGSFLLVRPLMVLTRFRMVFTKPAPMRAGMWREVSRMVPVLSSSSSTCWWQLGLASP